MEKTKIWLFLAFAFLLAPQVAVAKPYLVLNFSDSVRIVLNNGSCLIKGFKGNRAAVQRSDGMYMQGCWVMTGNDNLFVHIDWNNPKSPGDFAVLRFSDFHMVDED